MQSANRNRLAVGLVIGAACVAGAAAFQSVASPSDQPGVTNRAAPADQFFVTGDEKTAHLWARDGTALKYIGSAEVSKGGKIEGRPEPK